VNCVHVYFVVYDCAGAQRRVSRQSMLFSACVTMCTYK